MAALLGALVPRASPADEEDMGPTVWVVHCVRPCHVFNAVWQGILGLVLDVNGLVLR